MTAEDERGARMALTAVVDCGDPVASALVSRVDGVAAWAQARAGVLGEPVARRAAALDLAELRHRADVGGVRFVVPGDEEWPDQLADLDYSGEVQRRGGVPIGLWLRGPGHLGADLAEAGVTVVSGGAYGIDAAAHRGALAVHGPTVCVLANGVDVPYPQGNAGLFGWLASDHLLVSELPPGATPTRVRFLARNRVIAALAQGTVVVEAALRSGARNTASWALLCHRQLMAVPGPVHSTSSAAPHLMIRNGQASLVTSAADVLELVSPMGEQLVAVPRGESRPTDGFDPGRLAVYEAVSLRAARSSGEIALTAGVSVSSCLAELAALEQAGLVQADASGWRLARAGR